jgi:transposase
VDIREAKAIELADRGRVVRNGDKWFVFSLNSADRYEITLEPLSCTCPDFELRQETCKHTLAARIVLSREGCDFRTERQPEEPPVKWPRKSYPQNWPAYDAAQKHEKEEFLQLLSDLCAGIKEPERKPGRGRPPASLADQTFAACFKVFSTLSGRRFSSDLRDAESKGFVSQAIAHNSIARFLESEEAMPILRWMVAQTALPLKALETKFAADSSGFSACKFDRWYDAKYGRMHAEHTWNKVHIMTGVLTNCVTAIEIHDKWTADGTQLPPLVKATAVGFKIKEVSGDKAYGTVENFEAIDACGGVPYIAFKRTASGKSGGLWEKMFHMFSLRKEEYLRHYHLRSNVESTFSMVKRKFGDSVRSKTDVAMKNEVLAKFVCHNIVCCIQSAYEFGVEVIFGTEREIDPKMILKFPI